jgi:hypothetical protein
MTKQAESYETLTLIAADLMRLGQGQEKEMRTAAAAAAEPILAAADPAAAMRAFFDASHQPYLAAKASKAKAKATLMGRAWHRVKGGVNYHLDNAGYSPKWPLWSTGEGECSLDTKADAKAERKAKAEQQAEREQQALIAEQQQQQQAEVERLRSLSKAELARELLAAIAVSGHTADAIIAAMRAEMRQQAKASKAKASKAETVQAEAKTAIA